MRLWALAALNLLLVGTCATQALALEPGRGERGAVDRFLEKSAPITETATSSAPHASDAAARMLETSTRLYATPGQLDYDWSVGRVQLGRATGKARNTLQISLGRSLRAPSGLALASDRAAYEADAYEVGLRRDWSLMSFDAGGYDVDLSPHAGVGWTNRGGATAEAGATLQLTQRVGDEVRDALNGIGVRDGSALGGEGRWYMFAAASGRAVGLNMQHEDGAWDNEGWTTDAATALVGDAHVGVGWRKGPLQTSVGYIHREVKGQHMLFGQKAKEDSVVAFSFTVKPEQD